ncbi:hypothetical protein J6590_035183 [Homalodisca vitripennis]|nr:hypothetical protein J6590_035183 [Homalodisca vitripennis]
MTFAHAPTHTDMRFKIIWLDLAPGVLLLAPPTAYPKVALFPTIISQVLSAPSKLITQLRWPASIKFGVEMSEVIMGSWRELETRSCTDPPLNRSRYTT